MRLFSFARATALLLLPLVAAPLATASAQVGAGAHLTPFAGYLVTGRWYEGPIGTSIATSNSPMVGAQGSVPLSNAVALTGSLAYGSGDLRVGLPLLGGVNVGSAKTWMYDAGLEIGGLGNRGSGVSPFVTGGIGGMTNDIKASVFETRATNVAYTAGVGVDLGFSAGVALRVQAKDWITRFNTEDAVGFRAEGQWSHNWALTAGLKLSF